MKPGPNPLLRVSRLALVAITLGSLPAIAGTTWDGDAAPDTNIDTGANWNVDNTAPLLDGSQNVTFATAGGVATINNAAYFNKLTFNRNDGAGFTVDGSQTLSLKHSTSGGTVNFAVEDTPGNGVTTISAPFKLNTSAAATRLLTITNLEAGSATPGLVFSNTVNATTPANTFGIRVGGAGTTRFSGAISNISGIQQTFLAGSGSLSGTAVFAGNQALGSATVNIAATSSGTVASTALIQMGESTSDIQSWASTTINQNATISVRSTATTTGGASIVTTGSSGSSGGVLDVAGSLSATTLGIGSAAYSGTLKVSGSATFSGLLTTGATVGNKIIGGAVTNGTLNLASGTINGASTTIGGGGTDENNLNLVKQTAGTLNINGGTHTYTGTTTVSAGILNISGAIASPAIVNGGALNLNTPGGSSAAVTVNAGGTLGGEGATSSSLTFGAGASTLSFDTSTPTGCFTADSVDVSAATVIIVSPTPAGTNGTPYVVLKRNTGTFSAGDLAKFTPASRGGSVSLTGGNTEISFTPSAAASASLVWKGNDGTNPAFWDTATTPNWSNGGSPDRFFPGDNVTFDDSAASFSVVAQGASVSPGNLVFNNTTPNDYTLGGSGIGGGGSLTKDGTGLATVGNSLSHTGGIVVNSGVLSLGTTNTNTFTGGIDINGGELQFAGTSILGALNTQSVTLDGGGITFKGAANIINDVQSFNVTTDGSSINADTLNSVTWRIGGVITGPGNWSKSGMGILALGKNGNTGPTGNVTSSPTTGSTFSGTVTVTAGTLDVRNPDSLGTTAGGTSVNNAILEIFPYGQNQGVTISGESLSLSGASYFRSKNEDPDTDITNEWSGPVTVADDAVVGLGSPKFNASFVSKFIVSGTVTTGAGSVLNLGNYSATVPSAIQEIDLTNALSGSGSVTAQGGAGSVYRLISPGYGGDTTVNSATLKLDAPNTNNQSSSVNIAATGATLELNFAGTDTVQKLFIGGVQQNAGVYKATDNADPGIPVSQITGPGTLTVTSSPAPASGYATWASANDIPGEPPGGDFDNDGITNLSEYALGLTPAVPNGSPGAWSGTTVTFNKGADAIANQDVNYTIETSTDLGVIDPWAATVTQNAPDPSTTIAYTFTPGTPARKFARLRTVLIP